MLQSHPACNTHRGGQLYNFVHKIKGSFCLFNLRFRQIKKIETFTSAAFPLLNDVVSMAGFIQGDNKVFIQFECEFVAHWFM